MIGRESNTVWWNGNIKKGKQRSKGGVKVSHKQTVDTQRDNGGIWKDGDT